MTTLDLERPRAAAAPQATIRVALVGNPNSGKTAMFNALTGARQKVANYAGVTVERKEGHLTAASGRRITILDLPGTYSLRARSPDEVVTRDAVLGRLAGETPPDVVICVADATNLRLVLRLALELKAVGRPCVLALNMIDIAQRQGLEIDTDKLSRELAMPVVGTVAIMDLRLLGLASGKWSVTQMSNDTLRWTWMGFLLAAITGTLLFVSKAHIYAREPWFIGKLALIAAAGVNMAVFHFTTWKTVTDWDSARSLPTAAKVAGSRDRA